MSWGNWNSENPEGGGSAFAVGRASGFQAEPRNLGEEGARVSLPRKDGSTIEAWQNVTVWWDNVSSRGYRGYTCNLVSLNEETPGHTAQKSQ